MANTGQRVDPFLNFNFKLVMAGITIAAFHECSGLDSSIEIIEHREGGGAIRKLPGNAKFSNIVLKRGVTDHDGLDLYKKHLSCLRGEIVREGGSVVLLNRAGDEEVARWNFKDAWVAKWVGPSLTAEGNDVAIETLELAHEGIERG